MTKTQMFLNEKFILKLLYLIGIKRRISLVSVTQRIKEIKQPYGGYLSRKAFEITQLTPDKMIDSKEENIAPQVMGLVVDYLTRFILTQDVRKAFAISLSGAATVDQLDTAELWMSKIKNNDDNSIIYATQLVNYDTVVRAGVLPAKFEIPNSITISHIKELVGRSLSFFKQIGDVTEDGFTFEGGYTDMIDRGDGDFLTEDTLWDFKVSKQQPQKNSTLQLIIYYLMGKTSQKSIFKDIRYIGIYNPRLNQIYKYDMKQADPKMIETISKNVIGYD